MFKKLLFLTMCLVIPSVTAAATYHVSKSGSDSNTCVQAETEGTAKLTIAGASGGLSCLSGGDTLTIHAGTYVEYLDHNDIPNGSSASWANATTVQAETGDTVTLRPTTGGSGNAVIWFGSRNYIIVDRLILDAVNVGEGIRFGPTTAGDQMTHHIRFQNGEVKNAATANGIGFFDVELGVHSIELLDNGIHDNGIDVLDHGIYFLGHDNIIDGNTVYNSPGYGIHQYTPGKDSHDNIIRNNIAYDNQRYGILTGSGDRNEVYNNIVFNNGLEGAGFGGIRIGFQTTDANLIYNNTVYENANGPGIQTNADATNTVIKNNILYLNSSTINDLGVSTVTSNNLTTDPDFTDEDADDFTLLATSDAIDYGTTLTEVPVDIVDVSRPQGAAYDAGAYERVSTGNNIPIFRRRRGDLPQPLRHDRPVRHDSKEPF